MSFSPEVLKTTTSIFVRKMKVKIVYGGLCLLPFRRDVMETDGKDIPGIHPSDVSPKERKKTHPRGRTSLGVEKKRTKDPRPTVTSSPEGGKDLGDLAVAR